MAHINNDRGGKKKKRGKGKTFPSVKLGEAAVVGILRQASSPGILSRAPGGSNTILSLQQLHSFDQDSLRLPTDCSHLQCKLWAGASAAWLVSWRALCRHIAESLDVNQKLQPKGRKQRGKEGGDSCSGGSLFPWNLLCQGYRGLQAMAHLPPGGPCGLREPGPWCQCPTSAVSRSSFIPFSAMQQKIRNPLCAPSW